MKSAYTQMKTDYRETTVTTTNHNEKRKKKQTMKQALMLKQIEKVEEKNDSKYIVRIHIHTNEE